MIVFWTNEAIDDLENIFYYYLIEASRETAYRIVTEIMLSADRLQAYPESGQREELLLGRKQKYRYIVTGNYKLIYWVDERINIASVFDCRQNPVKMDLI
ncbi:MAG: type toxin-antitoxin system RelE/ParE family toxin [Bacteroidetes bacterium]|nr:type toxin-antitoxin system RelE/ParE family toxin [Bacteroidota bacterium]